MKIKRHGVFILRMWLAAIAICAAAPQRAHAIDPQTLQKGQSSTVSVDYDIGDAAIADPAIADFLVSKDRRSLYINGKGGGETTVTLWDATGTKRDELSVRVVTTTLKEVLDRARGEFGEVGGVSLAVRGGHVEIEGEVAEPEDFRRIEGAARSDPRLRSRVRLAGEAISQLAEAIAAVIAVPGVTVRTVRDRVVLEGIAYSAADAKRAVEIAKLYSPEVLDLIEVRESGRQVGRGQMVELSFHLMEVKRGALRNIGVDWAPGSMPASASGTAGTGGGAGLFSAIGDMGRSILGFVFGLAPKLRLLRESGDGRVLENPSVIVKSGEAAKIFSGSEVPYYKGQEVEFKRVGIEIDATPIATADGVDVKLSASLTAPASDLRGALDTNSVSTTALLRYGQSLVLGNVVRNGDVKMRNRAPRDIDTSSALFTLFLSKDFQSNRSEFVIFVTPRLVSQPTAAEAELRDFISTEEAMIRDRSRKEYASFASRRGEGVAREKGADAGDSKRAQQKKGRRWR